MEEKDFIELLLKKEKAKGVLTRGDEVLLWLKNSAIDILKIDPYPMKSDEDIRRTVMALMDIAIAVHPANGRIFLSRVKAIFPVVKKAIEAKIVNGVPE